MPAFLDVNAPATPLTNVAFCGQAHFATLRAPNGRLNVAFCVHAIQCPHFSTLTVPKSLVNVAFCVQPHFATATSENGHVNVVFCGHCPAADSGARTSRR